MLNGDTEDGWGFGINERFQDAHDDIAKAVVEIMRPRARGTPAAVEEEAKLSKNNMLSTYFLIRGAEVARFVGKLRLTNEFQGTGFMVSKRLLMTNWHVFHPIINTKRVTSAQLVYDDPSVTFGDVEPFRLCPMPENLREAEFALQPKVFFYENPKLDLAVVAVDEISTDRKSKLSDYGHCQAVRSEMEPLTTGDHINIIQYPEGRSQKLVLRENQIVHNDDVEPYLKFFEKSYVQEINRIHTIVESRDTRKTTSEKDTVDGEEVDAAGIGQRFEVPPSVTYRYLTDTEKGSSGAACFDDEWRLVCLHHAAVLSEAEVKRRQQGPCRRWCQRILCSCLGNCHGEPITTNQPYSANEGIKISPIIDHLEKEVFPDPQHNYNEQVLGKLFGKP